ncbi:MAG: cyclic-di-AMP receptor [Tissierellaceae bacterium]|nr:cyclic-di-AMP receptor [Tissierellaceae bacterium]
MKLVIAIIQDQFVNKVTRSLMQNKIRVTKLSSSGGFLNSGNTTLLIGTEEEDMDDLFEIIKENCKSTKVNNGGQEVAVGGANLFVLDMDKHIRI